MASSQDDDSEQTQAFVPDTFNPSPNVLKEYYVIDGPEKLKEDANVPESIEDGSASTSGSNSSKANKGKETEIKIKGDQMTQNKLNTKEADKLASTSTGNHAPRTCPLKCPPVNCKEKIIICLDLSEEMNAKSFRSRAGDKYSGLELAKRALKMFVMHKSQINVAHEFAFMIFTEEPTVIQGFSSRPQDLMNTIEETEMWSQTCGPLNLSKLYEAIEENVELPSVPDNVRVVPPPYIVRLLIVFGRSHSIPDGQGEEAQKRLEASPYFCTDVLYIHEPPSDDNKCEEIFNKLCELDHNGLSYILEASKYTPIFTSGAKLIAHPLQRPLQEQAAYKIGSLPVVPIIDERCV